MAPPDLMQACWTEWVTRPPGGSPWPPGTPRLRPASGRSPRHYRTAAVDPEPTFMTPPRGEPLCRKADDQVTCDRAVAICG